MEDDNSLVPAMIAVFLGLGGALAAVAIARMQSFVAPSVALPTGARTGAMGVRRPPRKPARGVKEEVC